MGLVLTVLGAVSVTVMMPMDALERRGPASVPHSRSRAP